MAQKRTNTEVVARAFLTAPPADNSLQSCDGPREWFLDWTLSLWNDLSTACVYQYASNIKGACRRMLFIRRQGKREGRCTAASVAAHERCALPLRCCSPHAAAGEA